MSAIFSTIASACPSQLQRERPTLRPVVMRAVLLVMCMVAVLAAASVGEPARLLQADAGLAQLLRGMALIKAGIALGAVALLLWRFTRPIGQPTALAYGVSAALMAGATMLLWQLTFIPLAAALFHIGTLAMLLLGWRDDGYTRPGWPMRRAGPVR